MFRELVHWCHIASNFHVFVGDSGSNLREGSCTFMLKAEGSCFSFPCGFEKMWFPSIETFMGKLTPRRLPHPDQIESVLDCGLQDFRGGQVSESWRRSAVDHRIDPESQASPSIITERELKISREPLENLILQAREEMDLIYAIVPHTG